MDDYGTDTSTNGILPNDGTVISGVLEDNNPHPDIDTSDDTDWFALNVQAGYSYFIDQISVTNAINYLNFTIYDSTGTNILSFVGGDHEFLAMETGIVYVAVTSNNSGAGSYTISATEDDVPGNYSILPFTSHPTVLADGMPINAEFEFGGDSDAFGLNITEGVGYIINLTSPDFDDTMSEGDFSLSFAGSPTGSGLTFASNPVLGSNFDFAFVAGSSELGLIDIASFGPTGNYQLTVSEDDFRANDTTSGQIIIDGAPSTAEFEFEFEFENDRDWFAVNVTAGETYLFEISSSDFNTESLGYEIFLPGEALSTGASYSYSDVVGEPDVVFEAVTSGTVYLSITSSDVVGSYNIAATVDDFGGNAANAGMLSNDGTIVNGALEYSSDQDWFAIDLTAGETYSFSITSSDLNFMNNTTTINLIDSAGSIVFSGIDGPFEYIPTTSETFYLAVESTDALGSYAVSAFNGIPSDINLTNSDDVYTATAADEVINALDGNDLVNAGGGNDTVNGGNGNDNLRGDAGDDYLDGGFGADILRGGAGADTLYGGAGTDVADYTTSGGAIGVTVNLTTNVNTGGDAQGDTIFFIDRVNGSTRADNITGNAAVNYLRGFAQDDTLIGLAGNDYLQGDAGADVLDGGAGTNDWAYYFSSPTGLTVNLGNTALNTGEAVGDTYIGIENLLGSQHDDFLYGDANNNFVRGVQGDDELYGGDGNDFLRGDQGADFHDGGNGVDWLYYATSSSAVTIDLGAGTASGGDAAGDTFANVERVYGSSFDDVITGDAGANYLRGSSGADTLIGGAGNDFLQGDSGADVLNGGAGSDWAYYASATTDVVIDLGTPANNTAEATGDSYISIENVVGGRFNDDITGDANDNTLRGFLGDDTLNGGGGDDILRGESGNDIFIFEVGGDNDVVIDWSDSDDMLDLSDFGFANNAAAMASAAQVGSDVVFTMGSDSITIEDTTLADITDNLIL